MVRAAAGNGAAAGGMMRRDRKRKVRWRLEEASLRVRKVVCASLEGLIPPHESHKTEYKRREDPQRGLRSDAHRRTKRTRASKTDT